MPADPVGAWRPANTAPRDGREILMAFGAGFDAAPPLVVAWCSRRLTWMLVGAEMEVLTVPTHWQPLPAPPAEPANPEAVTSAPRSTPKRQMAQ